MNYTLNQLQIFLTTVKAQSVTKAAEELHLTQPAVSIQLKNFQNQFEIPLYEVVGRKIYISDFGAEIAEAAENILEQVKAIDFKTMAFKGELTGKMKVSVVSTGKYIMPFFLADFLKINPGVELSMDVTNKTSVIESLETNSVDFALVSILPKNQNFEQIDLLPNKLFLIGNEKMTYKKSINFAKILENETLIFREKGSGTRQTMENFIANHNLAIPRKMELASNEAVKQAVIAGIGCSIMPLIGLKNELKNQQLKIIELKGLPISTTWSLIWPLGKKLNPVTKAFVKYMEKEKETIIKTNFGWYEQY